MRITDIRATPVTVPLEAPLRHANGCHWGRFVRTIVEVETDDGEVRETLADRLPEFLRHAKLNFVRLQATNDGIWEWNPVTDEIFLSHRARRLWAVPDAVPIHTRADLKRAGGFHRDGEDVIAANRTAGAGSFDTEYRIVQPNGEARWVRSQHL